MLRERELLTAAEVAEHLGVTTSTVMRWSWQGKIPARKLGHKTVRFRLDEVLQSLGAGEKTAVMA